MPLSSTNPFSWSREKSEKLSIAFLLFYFVELWLKSTILDGLLTGLGDGRAEFGKYKSK